MIEFETPPDAVSGFARQPKQVSVRYTAEEITSRILLRGARGTQQVHSLILSHKSWTSSVKFGHHRGGNLYLVLVRCATGSCGKKTYRQPQNGILVQTKERGNYACEAQQTHVGQAERSYAFNSNDSEGTSTQEVERGRYSCGSRVLQSTAQATTPYKQF